MKFDFTSTIEETKWIVQDLIPASQLCFLLAQAGVGKSLVLEDLCVCLIFGIPFGGLKTIEGDVLLIDQDTPTNVIEARLRHFAKAMQTEQKHELYLESMKGYSLENSLMTAINKHPDVKLVGIDCLHSICGKLNPNYTSDMGILAKLKKECLDSTEKTIIFNHHISEKKECSVEALMSGDPHNFSMSSSAIIQQADTYYIIGATAENGTASKFYIRPVAKRIAVKSKPLVFQMVKPSPDSERLEYIGLYEPEFDEVETDVLILFRERPSDMTVKEVYEAMGHKHGEKAVRKALISLEKRGMLVISRYKSNLFKYRLP